MEEGKITMRQIIEKWFKEDRVIYFNQNDHLAAIEGDTYLKYVELRRVEIYFGGSNGEVCILSTNSPIAVDNLIRAIIHPVTT
jgi:hypothetical protein